MPCSRISLASSKPVNLLIAWILARILAKNVMEVGAEHLTPFHATANCATLPLEETPPLMEMGLQKSFYKSQKGATSIEYALIGVLISTAIIGGVTLLGDEVLRMWEMIGGLF